MTVRVGVVGGGLVAQAMHLPYLAEKRDRFALAALAEPSATVREALGARYGIPGLHEDYRGLLGEVDALVVCSPAGTHAEIVLAALDAGVHVFVEKPMSITLRDADAIVAARDRARRVVQVGTMKRYDPAYERMLAELPDSPETLRYVSVVVHDPEFEPYFGVEIVRGSDVSRELIEATRRGEAEQVEEAVGAGDPDTVRAFSESYLGSLLHDLNVVHGLLERLGEPLPAEVVDGHWWNEGRAVAGTLRLANGSRADLAWIQLLASHDYRESVSFLLILPIALPGIITGMALNSFYVFAGLSLSWWTIVIGHATFCVVVVYNNVLARLRRTSGSLLEASMDLGADGWQTFRFVTWPVLSTALVAGGLLAFALSFDEVIVTTFTAGAQVTLPIFILDNLHQGQQLPVINVVAFVVIVLTVIPVVFAQRLMRDTGILRRGAAAAVIAK